MKAAILERTEGKEQTDFEYHTILDYPKFVENFSNPELSDEDEVIIRVRCCSISQLDLDIRQNYFNIIFDNSSMSQQSILGYDMSGIIERLGKEAEKNSNFHVGDEVMAYCPIDTNGGCAEYTVQKFYHIVSKPSNITHEEAAATLSSSIRAYTALNYKMKMVAGESILITEGASPDGYMAVQLAEAWGGRIFVTTSSIEHFNFLQESSNNIVRVIDTNTEDIVSVIMSETGGVGVDHIYDTSSPNDSKACNKNNLIRCLGINSNLVTKNMHLQLDPPDSKLLYLRGASVGYLFDQSWILSNSQQGRYLHILADISERLATQKLKPNKVKARFSLEQIEEAHKALEVEDKTAIGSIVINI